MFCGNGGSAADSQHLAAELVGRQNYNRAPAAGIALTVDTSALTAIGNDYGYDTVFSRQVEASAMRETSSSAFRPRVAPKVSFGRSRRRRPRASPPFRSPARAQEHGIADILLCVPATETAKIQELHITCGHIVFALVERILFPAEAPPE